jgi:tRNA1Val (adenine37-N6)-methyltransferase
MMGNPWFCFKQFTVYQKVNAMKVTTDACLFGSLFPEYYPSGGLNMLDIGTGTGLLALMLAQKNADAKITAVEINEDFAEEAARNISGSPFFRQIKLVKTNILDFVPGQPFHHIVCNPPFYENQLASPEKNRNLAHHASALGIRALVGWVKKWLHQSGTAMLLIPYYREQEIMQEITRQKMDVSMIIRVRQTPGHAFFRSILHFVHESGFDTPHEKTITIKDAQNDYTPEFTRLLAPFYLHL